MIIIIIISLNSVRVFTSVGFYFDEQLRTTAPLLETDLQLIRSIVPLSYRHANCKDSTKTQKKYENSANTK
jgi:hypothetical protein